MVLLIDQKCKIPKNVKIEEFSIVLYFPIVFHCLANNSRNFYAIDPNFYHKSHLGTFLNQKPKITKILKNGKIENFSIVLYFPIVFHCLANNSHNFYAIDPNFHHRSYFCTFIRPKA